MLRFLISECLLLVLTTTTHGQEPSRWTLTVRNNSGFDIYEMYISSTEKTSWEENLMRNGVLRAGSSSRIRNFQTGEYDVLLVDEDGDSCIVPKIQITEDETWDVTTRALLNCEFHQLAEER